MALLLNQVPYNPEWSPSLVEVTKDLTVYYQRKKIVQLGKLFGSGLFYLKDGMWVKTNALMLSDVIIRGYIEVYELMRQGVSSSVYGYLTSQLSQLKKTASFTDDSLHLGVAETNEGLIVRPSANTALCLAFLWQNKLVSLSGSDFLIPWSTIEGRELSIGEKAFSMLSDPSCVLLYRNIAEQVACGYQANLSVHRRFERVMERVTMLSSYQVLSSKTNRYVDLSSFLIAYKLYGIQKCCGESGFTFIHTNALHSGFQMSKVVFNYLRHRGFISSVSGRSFTFLGEIIETAEDCSKFLCNLSEDELALCDAIIALASCSRSLDPQRRTVSSRPISIVASGEVLEE